MIAFVALSFIGLFALLSKFPNRTSVVCAWAVADYVAYCVTLPEPGHGGRYQPFVLLLLAPLMAIGLMWILRIAIAWTGSAKLGSTLAWASMLAVAAMTAARLPRWKSALRDSTLTIESTHVKMARWLNQNYPPQTKMAVFDIGTIGYNAHINVVDLGGLVDRNYLPYLVQRRVPEYLRVRGVECVILPRTGDDTHFADLLNLQHTVRLIPIHTDSADPVPWKNGFDYTGNTFREQTLYWIDWVAPTQIAK